MHLKKLQVNMIFIQHIKHIKHFGKNEIKEHSLTIWHYSLKGDGVIIFLFNRSFRSKRTCKLLECASFMLKMYYIILHVITNVTGVKLESLKLFYGKCLRRTALL